MDSTFTGKSNKIIDHLYASEYILDFLKSYNLLDKHFNTFIKIFIDCFNFSFGTSSKENKTKILEEASTLLIKFNLGEKFNDKKNIIQSLVNKDYTKFFKQHVTINILGIRLKINKNYIKKLESLFAIRNEYNNNKINKVIYLCGIKFTFRDKKREKILAQEYKNSIYYTEPHDNLGNNFSNHNKNKRQILILGYYGVNNYGDELMLKNILQQTSDEDVEISVMFFDNYRYNFKQWNNIFIYYPPTNKNKLNLISDFYDELIIGGGAHIDDNNIVDIGFVPYMALMLSKKMIKLKKCVKWISVSSNVELKSKEYIHNLKYIVENCDEFSVRDTYSLDVLKNNGINTDKIKLVNDLVLNENNKKIIAVTLIDFFDDTKSLAQILNEIIRFIQDNNNEYKICFLPFFNERFHDTIMFEKLIKCINLKNVEYFIAPEFNNTESMLMMIKGCDIFVNMRYHASLLSLKYNKPTISICYDMHPHYINKVTYINTYFHNENNIISYKNYTDNELYIKLMNLINENDSI